MYSEPTTGRQPGGNRQIFRSVEVDGQTSPHQYAVIGFDSGGQVASETGSSIAERKRINIGGDQTGPSIVARSQENPALGSRNQRCG
jgi:hypothetical protein